MSVPFPTSIKKGVDSSFFVVFVPHLLSQFVHRSSRSYYLFFNYLSYYLYGEGLYAED